MSNIYYDCMRLRWNSNVYCRWSSLPDSDTGVVGHPTSHNSLGPFDDTLVLWRLSDAGSCCGHRHRLLFGDCATVGLNRAYWTCSHLSLNISLKLGESYSILCWVENFAKLFKDCKWEFMH